MQRRSLVAVENDSDSGLAQQRPRQDGQALLSHSTAHFLRLC